MPQKNSRLSEESGESSRNRRLKGHPQIAAVPGMDVSRMSDEELMLKVPESNPCFRELVERYQRPIFLFSYSMLGSKGDAEEVTQEAFLAVYKNASRFNPVYAFSSWLYTIASNLSKNVLRKQKRKHASINIEGVPDLKDPKGREPDAIVAQEWTRQLIAQAVASLKPKYSVVLMLRYGEGCSYDEIGQQLGLTYSAVDTRLYRAKNLLRAQLEKLGIDQHSFNL